MYRQVGGELCADGGQGVRFRVGGTLEARIAQVQCSVPSAMVPSSHCDAVIDFPRQQFARLASMSCPQRPDALAAVQAVYLGPPSAHMLCCLGCKVERVHAR